MSSLEVELRRALLAGVPELVAALLAHIGRPRLLSIKQAPVSYRALLAAERAGELTVYRVGKASFVAEAELFEFIIRTGVPCKPPPQGDAEPADDIAYLIEAGDARRAARGAK
jgi:hypothetical protein